MNNFDVQTQIKFCKEHREFFEKKVKVPFTYRNYKKGVGIQVTALISLLRQAEKCPECKHETIFGMRKKIQKRKK